MLRLEQNDLEASQPTRAPGLIFKAHSNSPSQKIEPGVGWIELALRTLTIPDHQKAAPK